MIGETHFILKILFLNADNGGASSWIGDGFCDDMNNNEACDYDDGDCCGLSPRKNFCIDCICKGKSFFLLNTDIIWFKHYFFLAFICKNDDECSGNGICHVGECECLPNYEYALDCSHYGCKYTLIRNETDS